MKPTTQPAITFDFETYAHHLKGMDLPRDQAYELLSALFNIMVQIVDYGFGVHPIQQGQAENACGQNAETISGSAVQEQSVLLSKEIITALEIPENTGA